nr:MAG TPA: hypothetical protein [Caudoviricetes sp.]
MNTIRIKKSKIMIEMPTETKIQRTAVLTFDDRVRQVVTLHIKPSTRGTWQHQLERDIKHQLNAGSVGLVHKVVRVHLMRN